MAAENVAMAEFSGGRAPENKPSLTHSFARLRIVALARSCPAREHAEQGFGIERLLKPLQLILSHPQRLRLEAGSFRSAEISTDVEEIILDAEKDRFDLLPRRESDAKPMKELDFLDRAVCGYTDVELGKTRSVAQNRATIIAGSGINPIDLDHGSSLIARGP